MYAKCLVSREQMRITFIDELSCIWKHFRGVALLSLMQFEMYFFLLRFLSARVVVRVPCSCGTL